MYLIAGIKISGSKIQTRRAGGAGSIMEDSQLSRLEARKKDRKWRFNLQQTDASYGESFKTRGKYTFSS